ncbi:hypothetical protein RB595_010323 [Gaeumannomyces hyphopodioides]
MRVLRGAVAYCAPVLLAWAVFPSAAAPFEGEHRHGRGEQESVQASEAHTRRPMLGIKMAADASGSCNTPSDRSCWVLDPSFDIHTDWAVRFPETGVVRQYDFAITEVDNFVGGDGQVKNKAMLINGQFPGPTIEADWGDRIQINVVNNLQTNGTGIHWHGMFQMNNNVNDGVGGVTECPIPPRGGTRMYELLATQYGTGWYHSHFSVQYGNGVLGAMVVRGPASANYDVDLGAYTIADWYYDGADEIAARVANPNTPSVPGMPGSPPPSDNLLFNGTNVAAHGGGGSYARTALQQGNVHLLRLVNPSVDNSYSVSLTGHSLTIVATDYVPVAPRSVSSVFMGIGQRYDVLIHADQVPGDYFLNVTFSQSTQCGASRNPSPAAIFSYVPGPASQAAAAQPAPPTRRQEAAGDGAPSGQVGGGSSTEAGLFRPKKPKKPKNPETSPSPVPIPLPKPAPAAPPHAEVMDSRCVDLRDLTPIVQRKVPLELFEPGSQSSLDLEMKVVEGKAARVFWTVNRSPINVSWNEPTLSRVGAGSFEGIGTSANVVKIPTADSWSFWVIQNMSPVPHPMHLHGHDLVLVGQSQPPADPLSADARPRAYDDSTDRATLTPNNPTRRDTTMLPAYGWIVLAFETNNPGAWLFHCHLAWHVSQGLSVQYLERPGEIAGAMDLGSTESNCEAWRAFYPQKAQFRQHDSGI